MIQGGGCFATGHDVDLTVELYTLGEDIWNVASTTDYTYCSSTNSSLPAGGLAIVNVSANTTTHTVIFDLVGVVPGTYDMTIVNDHTLMNVKRSVVVAPPEINVNFDTLLEGNANNDYQINALDFSTLVATYGKSTGETNFDQSAGFDESGQVNALDFSLLVQNYFRYYAPIEI